MTWAVLLAGGSGTRFWPLSTPDIPKQLLPLSGSVSTAEEAVERLDRPHPPRADPGGGRPAPASRPAPRRCLQPPGRNILVEPRAASTAPALIWATWEAHRRDP